MGDIAMTVPVIYSLAQQYPYLRITVLSRPFARCFFENLAPNVGFMEADFIKEYKGIKGLNALYRRLTAKNFTAVADLHNVLRTQYLRIRFDLDRHKVAHINKHYCGKRQLTRQNNKKLIQQPTSFQNYADVFAALGYPVDIKFKSIFPLEGGDFSVLNNKIGVKKENEKWIGIAPFAAHEGKIYPLSNMKKVIDLFIAHHSDCRIFLFGGGKDENEKLSEIASEYSQCINTSSLLNGLEEELILMSHLNVMISMDSANMHLASLVNVPVISIWGATHPYAGFMGWNQNQNNAVQIDLNCRPCSIYGNKHCLRNDYACIKNISPELITQRTELALYINK